MIIHWKPNPLETIVELDERDMEILRLKVSIEELEERIYEAHFHLSEGHFDPAEALKGLNVDGLDTAPFAEAVDKKLGWLVPALADKHIGDCTCVPCSCTKCHAESLLGINTIEGLGKHSAYKIDEACKTSASLEEAISRLQNYEMVRDGRWLNFPEDDFNKHVPRWKAEAERAATWLSEYRDTHFPVAMKGPNS